MKKICGPRISPRRSEKILGMTVKITRSAFSPYRLEVGSQCAETLLGKNPDVTKYDGVSVTLKIQHIRQRPFRRASGSAVG